jgi:hypothetical protein
MRNGILLTNVLAVWACTPPDAVLPAGCRDSPAICGPHTVCDVARDVCVLDAPVELGDGGDLQPRGDMGQGPTEIPLGFGACDDSGWCWRNPVPLGGPIGRILALDANNIWVAAGSNSVVKWDGAQWRYQKANIEISVADL